MKIWVDFDISLHDLSVGLAFWLTCLSLSLYYLSVFRLRSLGGLLLLPIFIAIDDLPGFMGYMVHMTKGIRHSFGWVIPGSKAIFSFLIVSPLHFCCWVPGG